MDELIITIQVQAEVIWSLRRDKMRMAQEIERLNAIIQQAQSPVVREGQGSPVAPEPQP